MKKKSKAKKSATVRRIIKSPVPSAPEKAEIVIHGADDLYREIRIENALVDDEGHKVKLKEHAEIEVVVEADPEATVPQTSGGGAAQGKSHSQD